MNLVPIFSTPIWESPLPDFETHKDTFLTCVENFCNKNPDGLLKSNIGGYQSPRNLTMEPELAPLFEYVSQMGMKAAFDLQLVDCNVYITAAWANISNGRNHYHVDHLHQDTFSGVFYLKAPEKSGKLNFINPGLNGLWQGAMLTDKKNKFTSERIKVDPVEGHIFLFPSYLYHAVEPNDHDDSRISISFNVICVPKEQIPHTK